MLANTAARRHFNADPHSFQAVKFLHQFQQRWSVVLQRAQSHLVPARLSAVCEGRQEEGDIKLYNKECISNTQQQQQHPLACTIRHGEAQRQACYQGGLQGRGGSYSARIQTSLPSIQHRTDAAAGTRSSAQFAGANAASLLLPSPLLTAPRATSPRPQHPCTSNTYEVGQGCTTGATSKSPRALRAARRKKVARPEGTRPIDSNLLPEPQHGEFAQREGSTAPTELALGGCHSRAEGMNPQLDQPEEVERLEEATEEHGPSAVGAAAAAVADADAVAVAEAVVAAVAEVAVAAVPEAAAAAVAEAADEAVAVSVDVSMAEAGEAAAGAVAAGTAEAVSAATAAAETLAEVGFAVKTIAASGDSSISPSATAPVVLPLAEGQGPKAGQGRVEEAEMASPQAPGAVAVALLQRDGAGIMRWWMWWLTLRPPERLLLPRPQTHRGTVRWRVIDWVPGLARLLAEAVGSRRRSFVPSQHRGGTEQGWNLAPCDPSWAGFCKGSRNKCKRISRHVRDNVRQWRPARPT
ncbi:unnamed protein product [Closterium sp. NIES-54]